MSIFDESFYKYINFDDIEMTDEFFDELQAVLDDMANEIHACMCGEEDERTCGDMFENMIVSGYNYSIDIRDDMDEIKKECMNCYSADPQVRSNIQNIDYVDMLGSRIVIGLPMELFVDSDVSLIIVKTIGRVVYKKYGVTYGIELIPKDKSEYLIHILRQWHDIEHTIISEIKRDWESDINVHVEKTDTPCLLNNMNESNKTSKVIFFIGPTGAGKTTTIAKMASNLSLTEKKNVCVMSADDYRVGGSEQLGTYANIGDIQFYELNDLDIKSLDLSIYDHIMVDTRAYYRKQEEQWFDYFSDLYCKFDRYEREIKLVLSATQDEENMIDIVNSIHDKYLFNIIFTKVDETSCVESMLNVHLKSGIMIEQVTFGQEVPETISGYIPSEYFR